MALSLRQARLCLDCDCLTDDLSCPWCDRDCTVPISGWFRPLDDDPSNAPRHGKAVAPPVLRWVLIVQPQQRDLYRVLRKSLVGTAVEVLYERRVGPRRRTVAHGGGRRAAPHRSPSAAPDRGRLPGPGHLEGARDHRAARGPAGRRGSERPGPAVASPPRPEADTGRRGRLDAAAVASARGLSRPDRVGGARGKIERVGGDR